MHTMKNGKAAYAAIWILFAVLLVSLAACIHMNHAGSMDDTTLTICTSVLSIVLTTVVVIFAVLYLKKDNTARYNEINHPDEGKRGE